MSRVCMGCGAEWSGSFDGEDDAIPQEATCSECGERHRFSTRDEYEWRQ